MAAIDFPASPSVGQAFTAGNGVTYTWNGLLWVASGASAGGDFYGIYVGADFVVGTTAITLPINTVVTGNSGGWYATGGGSIGRYTPPAGRYQIFAGMSFASGAAGAHGTIAIRKNGVAVVSEVSQSPGGGFSIQPIEGTFDANGSDYFEIFVVSNQPSVAACRGSYFGAYPISGIKGPPGDPGQLGFRLLQRTVVSSAVPTVDIIGIASDINDLKFTFDALPQTNAVGFYLQFFDSTGTIITSGYSGGGILTTSASGLGSAPFNHPMSNTGAVLLNYNAAGNLVNNTAGTGIRGSGNVVNIRDATRQKYVDWQCAYLTDTSAAYDSIVGAAQRTAAGSITGLRFFCSAGNIASGAISVWGSP